jgi:hypothetical protein
MPPPYDAEDIARLAALRDPVTWSRRERAERCRAQAAEFRRLAIAQDGSLARDELHALAEQYDRVAGALEPEIAPAIPPPAAD